MYALVDCNSFYASCEQIFRPDLRNQPIVVLSNNDGCIVARSKEAKALNIPELSPFFQIKERLKKHHVHIFSSNYALYGDISHRVMLTLSDFSPHVEVYSIDEMFLDMSDMNIDFKCYAHTIKKTLWQKIRMPVCVGIAPTKTLAKLANYAAKKYTKLNGVCVLDTPEKQQWLLKKIPVSAIWGVGKRTCTKLERHKIHTAWEFAQANPKQIRNIGSVTSERTARELLGTPCLRLDDIKNKKNIISSRSFGNKVTEISHIYEATALYCARATKKLRNQKQLVKTLYIFIKTSKYEENIYHNSCTIQLPYPTDDIRIITQYAKKGITVLFRANKRYAKVGVGLIELIDKNNQTYDLFEPSYKAKKADLMDTLDSINARFGQHTAFIAAQGNAKKAHSCWGMRQEYLSPAYTSDWNNLPVAKA